MSDATRRPHWPRELVKLRYQKPAPEAPPLTAQQQEELRRGVEIYQRKKDEAAHAQERAKAHARELACIPLDIAEPDLAAHEEAAIAEAMLEPLSLVRAVRLWHRAPWSLLESPNSLPIVVVAGDPLWDNPFGINHFRLDVPGREGQTTMAKRTPEQRVVLYVNWLRTCPAGQETAVRARALLRNRNLACSCAYRLPCHADILLRVAADESLDSIGQDMQAPHWGRLHVP